MCCLVVWHTAVYACHTYTSKDLCDMCVESKTSTPGVVPQLTAGQPHPACHVRLVLEPSAVAL